MWNDSRATIGSDNLFVLVSGFNAPSDMPSVDCRKMYQVAYDTCFVYKGDFAE